MGNCKGKAEKSEGKSIVSRQKKKMIRYLLNFILGLRKGSVSQTDKICIKVLWNGIDVLFRVP